MPPIDFLPIYTKAIQGGTEVTLQELIYALQLEGMPHVLEQVQSVKKTLAQCQLELLPDLTTGDLKNTRILRGLRGKNISPEVVISEISKGETVEQEFKSSLIYDVNRAAAAPSTPLSQLKSDEVAYSCLRTIAAFLTSTGGVLYVGVNDEDQCIGIEPDFLLLKHGQANADEWELHLRNLISTRFKDGVSVNDYVRIAFVKMQGKIVARLEVHKRKKLSFLKKGEGFVLFRRQGNRTVEVKIDEIEEFLELRQAEV